MSKFERTPITEASDQQIREFCEAQQLDGLDDCRGRADLLGVLGPAWDHDYILTVAAPADAEPGEEPLSQTASVTTPAATIKGGDGANDPKVRLKVGTTSMPGGKDPVPVGVNGKTLIIQRNVEVDLPMRFYDALLNSIRQEVDQDERTGELTVTEVTNYPLTVLALPSTEEVAAWRARTDNEVLPA